MNQPKLPGKRKPPNLHNHGQRMSEAKSASNETVTQISKNKPNLITADFTNLKYVTLPKVKLKFCL